MEEMSDILQKALEKEEPLRLRHPLTDQVYVLVRQEVFDRLAQNEGVAPGVLRSKRAFLRDLPGMLANPKFQRWSVAYCEDEQIALGPSEVEVVRECRKKGLQSHQVYIGVVAPYDHDLEIDPSLYEFDPIEE